MRYGSVYLIVRDFDNCGGDGFYYKIGYEDVIHWLHFRKR